MRDLEPEFILGSTEEFDTDVCHSLLSVLVLMSLMWLGDRLVECEERGIRSAFIVSSFISSLYSIFTWI